MFHAIYERADGMQACDWRETRPLLQKAFGTDVETLIHFFPSAHASIYRENGLLHAPLGKDIELIDFGTKEPITFPDSLRAYMSEIEFVNGYDQVRPREGGHGGLGCGCLLLPCCSLVPL